MKAALRVGLISSVVPKKCGIATFSRDLVEAMVAADSRIKISAVAAETPDEHYGYELPVIATIKTDNPDSYVQAVAALNKRHLDVVMLQHEFGLYGGEWAHFMTRGIEHDDPMGDYILLLLERLTAPVITTLHTVLPSPDHRRRQVIRDIAKLSACVVTMSRVTKRLLVDRYQIPSRKIVVIPHGVPIVAVRSRLAARQKLGLPMRNTYLTITGLLGPNKGVDLVIKALPAIIERNPSVRLLVAGQTHPGILAKDGEKYRETLVDLAKDLHVREHILFVNAYLPTPELMQYLRASDIYLTPHRDREQAASGTLAYAVGTGLPSVSTSYTYARELLANGRGELVPFESPASIARAVNHLLARPQTRYAIARKLRAYRRSMSWSTVAQSYLRLIDKKVLVAR